MLDRNWDAMKRALLILRHLRQEPANKTSFMKAARQIMQDAYSESSEKT